MEKFSESLRNIFSAVRSSSLNYKWVITCSALVMVLIDYIFPLSTNGLFLFLIALLPFAISFVSKISRHADGRIDFELQAIERNLQNEPGVDREKREIAIRNSNFAQLHSLFENDPNLALVWLRIEIEKRLRVLYGGNTAKISTQNLINELMEKNMINNKTANMILDLMPTLNQAAHGAFVSEFAISSVQKIAESVLSLLDDAVNEQDGKA